MSHREARCQYANNEYKLVTGEVEELGAHMIRPEWER